MRIVRIQAANQTAMEIRDRADRIADAKNADPDVFSRDWTREQVILVALLNGLDGMERLHHIDRKPPE